MAGNSDVAAGWMGMEEGSSPGWFCWRGGEAAGSSGAGREQDWFQ